MKITCITALVCTFSFFCFSQETEEIDRTGNVVFDPVIGIPNAGSFMLIAENVFDNNDANTITTNTSIPVQFGGRLEYMISNNIGFAFEGNYEKSGFKKETTYEMYNYTTGTYYDSIATQTWTQTKTRFLARFQYHPVQKEHVDFYLGAGLGLTLPLTNVETEPKGYDPDLYSIFQPIRFFDRLTDPLAARIFLGTRVLFTENIGMVMEFGLGSGSVLNLGLTARF